MAGLAGASSAVIAGQYAPCYYAGPCSFISQAPLRPGPMYQPLGLRPGWGGNGLPPPTGRGFPTISMPPPRTPQDGRHNRGRINRHMILQGCAPSATYIPHLQQPIQPVASFKDQHLQCPGHDSYVPNGRSRGMRKGSEVIHSDSDSAGARPWGTEMMSSLITTASPPEQQKQILGEHLYPLVQKHKPDLVAKITGMLMELPESLAAKIEEAVQVLNLSESKSSSQATLHPRFLSSKVAVN